MGEVSQQQAASCVCNCMKHKDVISAIMKNRMDVISREGREGPAEKMTLNQDFVGMGG